MSRIPKIQRTSYDYERPEMPNWLAQFANSLNSNGKPKSAVEVARNRSSQSILDQISSLVVTRPKHSTVDSIVDELRERTGLKQYLENLSRGSSEDSLKKKLNRKADRHTLNNDNKLPKSLSQYRCADNIVSFVNNTIETMHGKGVTIPQLQQDILSTFGSRYGISSKDVMNNEVAKYLNDCIISAQTGASLPEDNPNIGAGLGSTENEDEDKDAFKTLLPAVK